MKLTIKQTIALDKLEDDSTKEVLFGGGAGGGKSALGCYWIIKSAIKYEGSRWLIGRARLKTLKETTLITFFEICKLLGVNSSYINYNQQSGTITFYNGSQILLKDLEYYPSDPNFDELGSLEITGAFIDECNQINEKAKQIVGSRIRYKLDEYKILPKMLMTCNPAKGWIFDEFYLPYKNSKLDTKKAFIQSLASDNSNISVHYNESLQNLSEQSRQRLQLGNWEYENETDRLMDYDAIQDYFKNSHVPHGTQTYITADISRKGKDKTTIRVWAGFVCIEVHELSKSLITETSEYVLRLAEKHKTPKSKIVVDEDGVGGGVCDIVRCYGFINNSKAIGKNNYSNLKAQCSVIMANMINNREVYEIETHFKSTIVQEIETVKYLNIDKDGKIQILGKDKVKEILRRSPDHWDSIMMRAFFTLGQSF
jgi:phage terminase large subunit